MEKRIKEIIKREFKAEVIEIVKTKGGFSHFMYSVKINKSPQEVIVRFSNNLRPNVNLAKEKSVMELLRKNRIPAPKILAFHFPENKSEGYMILEKIKGERLDLIWDTLSEKERISISEKIGKLLASIHKIKFDKFGFIKEGGSIDFDEGFKFTENGEIIEKNPYKAEQMKEMFIDLSKLAAYDHTNKEFLLRYFEYLIENREKLNFKGKPCLVHGDFMPGHLFIRKINGENKIVGIIDFEFAQSYSPENDFLKLHRSGFFDIPDLKESLMRGYGSKIDEGRVEFLRIQRDLSFATCLLDSGNKKLSDKILLDVETKINKSLCKKNLDLFDFPKIL